MPGSPIDPNGVVMDFLRSGYATLMFLRDGGDAREIQWYFADDDAIVFPALHRFASLNYETSPPYPGPPFLVGEDPRPPKPWRSPINRGFPGDSFAGPESYFTQGVPTSYEPLAYGPAGIPLVCVPNQPQPVTACQTVCGTAEEV